MKLIRPVVLAVSIALAGPVFGQQGAETIVFSIPRTRLQDALSQWSKATGLQVFSEAAAVRNLTANPVVGSYTSMDALRLLLQDTDLTFDQVSDQMVAIKERKPATTVKTSLPLTRLALQVPSEQTTQAGAASSVTQSPESGSPPPARSDASIETVMVTAQKRMERLIDAPQSVSVYSADTLKNMAAAQFRDFANTVPGLSFSTAGAGNTQISLRGVTIGQDLGATVGIYVDETPYGSSAVFALGPYLALDAGLFDVDRIEVLRGPQGTLYGASTMGGLIKYVTKKPVMNESGITARGGASWTRHGDLNYDVAGTANVPLAADKAALRVSAYQSHDGGFIENIASGEDYANRSDIYGGRVDLLLTPNEQLDVRLTGFLQDIERDGEATADYTFAGDKPLGELSQNRQFDEPFVQRFRLLSATVGYDFGPVALTSISTYQTSRSEFTWDVSSTYVPLLNSFGFGPYGAIGVPNISQTNKFSQEVRLAAQQGGTLEWVIGGFYTREKSRLTEYFSVRDPAGVPLDEVVFEYFAPTEFKEYAAFGDVTVKLTEKFDITAGVRYAKNDQEFTQIGGGPLGGNVPTKTSDEDVFTYLGSARYHISENATAYLRYATGYRPGGPNIATVATAASTFDSDELKSYEAGVKAETESRRFGVDLSVYHIDWENIQISVNINGFTGYDNAPGGADINGAELTLTSRPVDGLSLSGAFAFQDAQLAEADVNLGGVEGERLPNVPRFMASLNADYDFRGVRWEPSVGATVRHVGERESSFDASTSFPQYRLPEYTALDLRAGVTFGNTDAQLYVRNATDERGQLSLLFAQFGARVAIMQPRTIGFSVTTNF